MDHMTCPTITRYVFFLRIVRPCRHRYNATAFLRPFRHGACRPGALWKLAAITKSGMTSDWAAVEREHQLLGDTLDKTDGRLPNFSCLRTNLKKWLDKNDKDSSKWTSTDVEGSSYSLNVMFRSLRFLKVNKRSVPRRYKCLETVIARIKFDEAKPLKEESEDEEHEDADFVDLTAVLSSESEEEEAEVASVKDDVDWDNLEQSVTGDSNLPIVGEG